MNTPCRHKLLTLLLLLTALFLFSCSQQTAVDTSVLRPTLVDDSPTSIVDENQPEHAATLTTGSDEETELELVEVEAEQPAATPTIQLTPTPDLRLLPEQWQQWPVIPEISPNATEIYWRGIAMGNDPQHFSKIGDCQSIKEVMMGIYDMPNRYRLREGEDGLQEIIDQFTGSFNRDGMGVKGGFNAATVLSPIWADPDLCKAGETPIECEFRVHNPSIVIISLEVWWQGRSPERYEQYMRKIIETAIAQGIVPILSTKADNVEGNHSINYTTAKLAYEYDIPLWNFWLAAQSLPHQGIDPARDGFHITVTAWNERSFTALKSLEAVWQAAHTLPMEVQPGDEEDAAAIYAPVLFPTASLADNELTGQLFIETTITREGNQYPNGIYVFDFDKGLFEPAIAPGYQILSQHPDYGILVGNATELGLYRVGAYQPFTLSAGSEYSEASYLLLSEASFVQVKPTSSAIEISVFAFDTRGNVSLTSQKSFNTEISSIADLNEAIILAEPAECTDQVCDMIFIDQYLSDQPAISRVDIGIASDLHLNTQGIHLAYWKIVDGSESLFLGGLNPTSRETYIGLFGNVFLDQAWSHTGTNLAVIKMNRSDYYGKATELLHFIVNAKSSAVKTLPEMDGLNPQVIWSPDDLWIITSATMLDSDGSAHIVLRMYDVAAGQVEFVQEANALQSDVFIAITNMVWHP